MGIPVVIISVIAYLIMINCCLTFRLTVINNIVITMIIFANMLGVGFYLQVGSLFTISMLLMICVYIFLLNKKSLLNLFLIMFSYVILVIINNTTDLIWSNINLDINAYWPIYVLVNYPIYIVVFRLISKGTRRIMKQKLMSFSPKMLIITGINFILYMFIFIIHIVVVDKLGYSSIILLGGIMLYLAYFILSIIILSMIAEAYEKITMEQRAGDNLLEYVRQAEEVYQNLRSFKHDYSNVIASMAGYIDSGDIEKLRNYYNNHVLPIEYKLERNQDAISRLYNLGIIELKSLISIKLSFAQKLNIGIDLEIMEKVEKINMNIIDLVRIVGILLDNAIEACQECKNPFINLSIIKSYDDITIIVKNNYVKQDINYSRLGNIGVSSKGKGRGNGLYNIKTIVNEYDNVTMDTTYEEKYFVQVLEIYRSMYGEKEWSLGTL